MLADVWTGGDCKEKMDASSHTVVGWKSGSVKKEAQMLFDLSRARPSAAQHGQQSWLTPPPASAALLGFRFYADWQTIVSLLGKYYSNFNPGLAQRNCELCVTVSGDSSDPLVGIYR